jgi:hypothetical protein
MKKFSIVAIFMILFSVFNSFGENEAYAAFACDGAPGCISLPLYKGETYKASPSIYLKAGQTALIEFETNPDSVHHVAFAAYSNSGTQVTPWQYAGYAGGNDNYYWSVPTSGYYYLFAACKGGEASTCTGGGTIRSFSGG